MSNANSQEIELKLSCSTATAHTLGTRLTELTGSLPSQQLLRNTYYDTPQQTLRQQGAALRIRVQGRQRLQTVKCSGQSQGGLSSRPEWETPYRGAFDFSAITDPAVRHQLQSLADAPGFQATLTTDFTRTTWAYRPSPGIHILLMLDRGHIQAGGRRTGICELELELVQGSPADLLNLAWQLNEIAPLFPSPLSKAARGGLLLDQQPTPRRTPRPAPAAPHREAAFVQLLQDCLDQISLHHPANCQPFTATNLHQVRVGLRHLRALLQLFGRQIRGPVRKYLTSTTRQHLHALNRARNLHVLHTSIVMPSVAALGQRTLKPLLQAIAAAEKQAQAHAADYLQSHAFSRWLLACSLALHDRKLVRKAHRHQAWLNHARDLLQTGIKDYTCHLQGKLTTPRQQHRLRLRTKYLRYCLATLSAQGQPKAAQMLAELQETLGQLNDLYTAGATLQPLLTDTPALQRSIAAVGEWHQQRHATLLADTHRQCRNLARQLKHLGKSREMQ